LAPVIFAKYDIWLINGLWLHIWNGYHFRLSALRQTDNPLMAQYQKMRSYNLHKCDRGRYGLGKKSKDSLKQAEPS